MNTAGKLTAFVAAVAVAFGGAMAVGGAVGPIDVGSADSDHDTTSPVAETPARGLAVPLIPAGHVVDHDDGGKRPGSKGTRKIGIDEIALEAGDGDGFREHAFVHTGLIHGRRSSSAPAAQIGESGGFYHSCAIIIRRARYYGVM